MLAKFFFASADLLFNKHIQKVRGKYHVIQ